MQHGVDLESYYDLRLLSEVSVSPDGERVAFTAQESDPAADEHRTGLYVAPVDGSRDPHRLTRASSASSPTWGPDGDTLAFLAAREEDLDRKRGRVDDGGDESAADGNGGGDRNGGGNGAGDDGDAEPKPQVWAFDLALGGDARQLTAFEHGVDGVDLRPTGSGSSSPRATRQRRRRSTSTSAKTAAPSR
ncbi:TolB family protein [Halobaculum halobium]|uniref:TolB family protein n=1 Tax=Halobaculum halobium TaxID=3032281 RepID=UPI00361A1ADE